MKQAKDVAINLPGGELLIKEQDQVIDMLEKFKDHKRLIRNFSQDHNPSHHSIPREQLSQFAKGTIPTVTESLKMEIDSMASTPCESS